jgi:hypothetical protein
MDDLALILACDLCRRDVDTIGPCVLVVRDGSTTLGAQCARCATYGPPPTQKGQR